MSRSRFIKFLTVCAVIFVWAPGVELQAQKHDNVWVFGYHYFPGFVPGLDFYYTPPDTIGINSPLDFFGTTTSISNTQGDLKLYTNGTAVCNFNNDTLPGSFHFNYEPTLYGLVNDPIHPEQSVIMLPDPGNPDYFTLFHMCGKLWNNNQNYQPVRLGWSRVNMNGQGGQGYMFQKDSTVFSDTLLFQAMQAVKHGNGRDWWVVNHKWQSDKFYISLLTPDGVDTVIQTATGPVIDPVGNYSSQTCFSTDGSKFIMTRSDSNEVYIFDFDRCSGSMQFQETINFPIGSTMPLVTGCSVSPDGHYLYINTYLDLYQYDLTAAVIGATQVLIDSWDGTGSFNPYYFMKHRLAPDGKIYVFTPSSFFLHVINDPNQPGVLCNFNQHAQQLKAYHAGRVPDFPNYRLGSLTGSVCDSLTGIFEPVVFTTELHAYPNPASSTITFSFDPDGGAKSLLEITDIAGRLIRSVTIAEFSTRYSADLSGMQSGVYLATVKSGILMGRVRFVISEQ
jgi:hypothetical protein